MNHSTAHDMFALRMDDVGASSKRFEVYSDWCLSAGPLQISGNWLFLKFLPGLKKWGPYRELNGQEWHAVLQLLEAAQAKLTVAVTAAWVDYNGRLMPFPRRFPDAAAALKEGVRRGILEIANHGLTHCVLKNKAFRPKWFSGNRRFHREYWDWVPSDVQEEHMQRSQNILESFFEVPIVTFVPPGNVFTDETLRIARRYGLKYVSCDKTSERKMGMSIIGEDHVLPFHDRDLVLCGISWLEKRVSDHAGAKSCFVRELADN
jgi:peptidoglycan/xylan/chitin deacetylase (PgdA/CDA1 family)